MGTKVPLRVSINSMDYVPPVQVIFNRPYNGKVYENALQSNLFLFVQLEDVLFWLKSLGTVQTCKLSAKTDVE